MSKLKTNKTLAKRIKITKGGKIVKKHVSNGHLKQSKDASTKTRKSLRLTQDNKGHIKVFKKLMGTRGKGIK